jgi:transcriptional regulator with XRE-family HTH domain
MSTTEPTLTDAVRERIHAEQAAGRSISELARLSGISQSFLSQFASGTRATISSDSLGQLLPVIGGKVVWKKPPKP